MIIICGHLANLYISCSELRSKYPGYFMSKDKIMLDKTVNVDKIINEISEKYSDEEINNEDGLKIDFENSWVQLRKSNTEPIIRVYSEAKSQKEANMLSSKFIDEINMIK